MRLTREKSIRLSHVITDVLVACDDVEFIEDRDTIRQKALQILQDLLKEEEAVDAEVRKKISSQKKEILEEMKSGTCSIANIMRMRCAAWELFTCQARLNIPTKSIEVEACVALSLQASTAIALRNPVLARRRALHIPSSLSGYKIQNRPASRTAFCWFTEFIGG